MTVFYTLLKLYTNETGLLTSLQDYSADIWWITAKFFHILQVVEEKQIPDGDSDLYDPQNLLYCLVSNIIVKIHPQPVSYTHLTLPTILRV